MTINPNQISVAKIYPGNYTNVLRYWHEEKTMQFENANGVQTSYTNQPVGGPVGVVFRPGWIAQQAIGYRQVVEHLEGVRDLPATVAEVKARTWQYGRRQMTWFRHRPGVVWVDVDSDEPASMTAERILIHPEFGTHTN